MYSHHILCTAEYRSTGLPTCSWSAEQGKLIFPCPRSRLRVWSRKTGLAVPFRVSLLILHTQAESDAYYTGNRVSPEFIGSRNCVPMAFAGETSPAQGQYRSQGSSSDGCHLSLQVTISYLLDTLIKTGRESIEAILRRRRMLFAGFVARMKDTRLPKCVVFGELVGGAGCVGDQEKEWMGCFLDDLRVFGINAGQYTTAA